MARMIGGPSKYLKDESFWSRYESVTWVGGMILSYCVYLLVHQSLKSQIYLDLLIGVSMLGVYRLIDRKAWKWLYRAWNFEQGADGEARVAKELQKLPDTYTVIQDVKLPSTKTNIDFVVLGPNGIWAVEVKSHRGKIAYNGNILLKNGYPFEKDILSQARAETKALTDYLQSHIDRNLYANGILVFSNPKTTMHFGEAPVREIAVIGILWFNRHILEQVNLETLTEEAITNVTNLLLSPC